MYVLVNERVDVREGYCYYTLANDGRCLQHSDRVPAITKPACCCTGGAAWGHKCEKCPAVGTGNISYAAAVVMSISLAACLCIDSYILAGFVTLAHFSMHRFIYSYLCVFGAFSFHTAYLLYYCERSGVDLIRLRPDLWNLSSFSALTLLVGSFDPFPI